MLVSTLGATPPWRLCHSLEMSNCFIYCYCLKQNHWVCFIPQTADAGEIQIWRRQQLPWSHTLMTSVNTDPLKLNNTLRPSNMRTPKKGSMPNMTRMEFLNLTIRKNFTPCLTWCSQISVWKKKGHSSVIPVAQSPHQSFWPLGPVTGKSWIGAVCNNPPLSKPCDQHGSLENHFYGTMMLKSVKA